MGFSFLSVLGMKVLLYSQLPTEAAILITVFALSQPDAAPDKVLGGN